MKCCYMHENKYWSNSLPCLILNKHYYRSGLTQRNSVMLCDFSIIPLVALEEWGSLWKKFYILPLDVRSLQSYSR